MSKKAIPAETEKEIKQLLEELTQDPESFSPERMETLAAHLCALTEISEEAISKEEVLKDLHRIKGELKKKEPLSEEVLAQVTGGMSAGMSAIHKVTDIARSVGSGIESVLLFVTFGR